MIAVPFVALLFRRDAPTRKWRALAVALGMAAVLVNSFWLIPFCVGYLREPASWGEAALPGLARDLTSCNPQA